MSKPLFLHRPPTEGIHLLNDPLPERVVSPYVLREKQPAVRRATLPAKSKKGLRS